MSRPEEDIQALCNTKIRKKTCHSTTSSVSPAKIFITARRKDQIREKVEGKSVEGESK